MASPVYPKTAVNKLGRLANRGTYDYATVHSLINTCPVLHVSFNDPQHEFPVVLPMLGCTGNFSNQTADPDTTDQDIYIHGYVSGRVFKSGKDAEIPITIAATHLDGLVLALSAFHNSCNYRSAVVYGHATLVTSEDEKLYAMQLIANNLLPTRWESSRNPPTSAEMTSTSILRIRIASASAKIRSGGPSEERADLKNSELVKSVWTGVVPRWSVWGDPVRGDECGYKEDEVEDYIEGWRLKENQKEKATAYEAIEKKK